MKRTIILALALTAGGCDGFGDALTSHTDLVARAGAHELTVDEMVELLAGNARIPAQTEVVASVADLWVDYTILAELLAEDSTLAGLDLSGMVEPYIEQRTFLQLREQVVTQDTIISDDELREIFAQGNPGLRVRARHILVDYPEGATDAQRDSVRALAEDLRRRAEAGEDFATLAQAESDDPGSGQRGGDLGWFGSGEMVGPFEQAAFALQPGEVSDVVETPFGLHVIKVEERESPSFDEMGRDFRQQAVAQRRQASLDEYVSALTDPVDMEVEDGAGDIVRDLARRPSARLTGRASARELVTWDGGELTAGEFLRAIRRMPPQQRAGFGAMRDEQMHAVLEDLATNELVLADAGARGITVPEEERDSVTTLLREQISQVSRQAGLGGTARSDESQTAAVERRVRTLLENVLAGRADLLPLGALPYALRQQVEWRIHERAFPVVVEELEARRSQEAEAGPAPSFPMPAPTRPDTVPPGQDTAAQAGDGGA
ncbi:MAG TPA: peptidylprolyl isomerase [Longimicrobiales bacterium]|nr:peptidylprolyl isomerase [Longimicrobiales bacterium]